MRLSPFSRLFLHFGGRLAPAFPTFCQKCSFIFRMVVVYWSWNCESCPEIKYFSLFLRTALLFQLIPARGRKPESQFHAVQSLCISTYPRKGTKTSIVHGCVTCHRHFNLSPQGDENGVAHEHPTNLDRFQLIPARGRKLIPSSIVPTAFMISTYPRKGTETTIEHGVSFAVCLFQLIPARGRKLNCLRTTYIKLRISTYPRKNPLRRCAPALPKGELL